MAYLGEAENQLYALLDNESLPGGLTQLLEECSRHTPVAYVEAEFFGGTGQQASVVWEQGALAFGPVIDPPETDPPPALGDRAINQALRWMGIRPDAASIDEFEAIDLGRHRETDDWLA